KDLPFRHRGYDTHMTVEDRADPKFGMGDIRYATHKPIEFDVNRYDTEQAVKRRIDKIKQTYDKPNWLGQVNELYRENYIAAMENQLGFHSKELQDHIKGMSIDDFIVHYYTENNAHIDFVYDLMEIKTRVQELERVW